MLRRSAGPQEISLVWLINRARHDYDVWIKVFIIRRNRVVVSPGVVMSCERDWHRVTAAAVIEVQLARAQRYERRLGKKYREMQACGSGAKFDRIAVLNYRVLIISSSVTDLYCMFGGWWLGVWVISIY
jgi:hypothetical protein